MTIKKNKIKKLPNDATIRKKLLDRFKEDQLKLDKTLKELNIKPNNKHIL